MHAPSWPRMRIPFTPTRKTRKPARGRGRATSGRNQRSSERGGRYRERDPRDRARELRERSRDAISGLEQRHLDVIGLALVALGLYLGFVLYGEWDGGRVGGWAEVGLSNAVGKVAYVVPFALAAWGLSLMMRPFIAAPKAVNAGGILVLCALLLAFAAETAGLGPDHPARHDYFQQRFFTEHGGAAGEGLYWATTTLFQRLGAQIVAVLMFVSGILLLSGATVAGVLSAAGRAARRAHQGTREVAGVMGSAHKQDDGQGSDWDPAGDDIAITRADPTEPLITRTDDEPEEPDWDDEAETAAAGPDSGQFAYEDAAAGEVEADPDAEPEDLGETPMGAKREKEGITASEERDFTLPEPKVLERGKGEQGPDTRDRDAVSRALLESLEHFGIEARLLGVVSGPHVSRYELQLAPGTKVAKVAQLKDDLAYALASTDIRILAPIPGKKAVGVEVPNQRRRLVRLGDIYDGRPKGSSPLAVWLGKDVAGHAQWTDLALMPHALVAGTTGSGKSGSINTMLCSILLHASPNEVRLVLVDPKRVELNHYEKLPHLLTPVVTNPRLAANVLANLIGEMESRYSVMGEARARNLVELNRTRKRSGEAPLPHILCVIDELADLMMVAPAEVEDSIIRLAQKSRAVGIHLVLATQRPSTDVITGTIKVNIPARIAFSVASQVDSRVILDQGGAESLLGQGDMLFRPVGTSKLSRIQGAFVTEDEIARIAKHWARQGEPEFDAELLEVRPDEDDQVGDGEFSPDEDDLLADAARTVVESETASVSMLQRRLRVGYTRAGRLVDMLERRGIISGYEGSKPRQVLVSMSELPRLLERLDGAPGNDSGPGEDRSDTQSELEPLSG
jgi:S-DNA-T family DNA segregation ATPase FtsK/SpoIIIE